MPVIWNHGKQIASKINEYKCEHGSYPSKKWFAESYSNEKTVEGRSWIYLNPPFKNAEGKDIVIVSRVDYLDAYSAISTDGDIRKLSLEKLVLKNEANKTLHTNPWVAAQPDFWLVLTINNKV